MDSRKIDRILDPFVREAKALSKTDRKGVDERSKTAKRFAKLADQGIELLQKAGTRVECRRGCDACCHRYLMVTVDEAVLIAQRVQNWPVVQRAGLTDRLSDLIKKVEPFRAEEFGRITEACPFLVNHECSIYESRPLVCRGASSIDADICWEGVNDSLFVPLYGPNGEARYAFDLELLSLGSPEPKRIPLAHTLARTLADRAEIDRLASAPSAFIITEARSWRQRVPDPITDPLPGHVNDPGTFEFLSNFRTQDYETLMAAYPPTSTTRAVIRITTPPTFRSVEDRLCWRNHFDQAIEDAYNFEPWNPFEAYVAAAELRTIGLGYHLGSLKGSMTRLGDLIHERIAIKVAPDLCEPLPTQRKPGKVRVGVIGDLGDKSASSWALGWVKEFDRSLFEVYAIKVYGPEERMSLAFKDSADHYIRFAGHPFEMVRAIRRLDLDYLIFTDIGDTRSMMQYAMFRLARRQATAWGTPFTSGLKTIDDYLSSDFMEKPGAQEDYRENLVRLPGHGLVLPPPNPLRRLKTRADFGLPSGFLVSYPQYVIKWQPEFDELFARISAIVKNPIVVSQSGLPQERDIFEQRVTKLGARIQWLPSTNLLRFRQFLPCVDAVIDSPGWSGGLTAMHALGAGVPFLAHQGEYLRQRLGLGFLNQAGVGEWAMRSQEDYLQLVAKMENKARGAKEINSLALYEFNDSIRALESHVLMHSS